MTTETTQETESGTASEAAPSTTTPITPEFATETTPTPEETPAQTPAPSDIMFSWTANNVVNVPIIFAIVGFFYAIYVFKGGFGKVGFHEIYLQNKDSLSSVVVSNRIINLTQSINAIGRFETPLTSVSADSNKYYNPLYNSYKNFLTASYKELTAISNGDSSLIRFATYANINMNGFKQVLDSMQSDPTGNYNISIPVTMRDTFFALNNIPVNRNLCLELKKSNNSLTDYFSHNSTFGFWLFLSIAQMTLWFLLIPLVVGSAKQTDDIALTYNIKSMLLFSIIPVVFIGFFAYLLYWNLIDSYIIDDVLFMQAYNHKMLYYSVPGYITAILCLSTYLFLSNNLELLDPETLTATQKQDQYMRLSRAFNFSFLCSALVLTVFVIWAAMLFNAINSTEVLQFYKLETGKAFLNNDFVYLIGLIHSLILFIFYIPVKIRFNSLDITKEQKQLAEAGLTPGTKFWKNALEVFSTLFVTTSPIIASLIPELLKTAS